jgi:hypothetical protein
MKIPYGTANFAKIRREGYFYVDKTPFLPVLESAELGFSNLIFLRPRRMGKSALVSMMEHYYNRWWAGEFDALLARVPGVGDREALLGVLEQYYNGYRFSPDAAESVFNSDMVLYILSELADRGRFRGFRCRCST